MNTSAYMGIALAVVFTSACSPGDQSAQENTPGAKASPDFQKQLLRQLISAKPGDVVLIPVWGKNLLDNQYVGIPGGLSKDSFGTVHASVNQPLSSGSSPFLFFVYKAEKS